MPSSDPTREPALVGASLQPAFAGTDGSLGATEAGQGQEPLGARLTGTCVTLIHPGTSRLLEPPLLPELPDTEVSGGLGVPGPANACAPGVG